jgi:hypothetical protein
MTATKNNDTKETVTDLASGIIPGLRKHFPNGAQMLTFGGGSVTATVDQTVTNLQALIDNRTAVTTAQAAVKVAIAAENGKMPALVAFLHALEAFIRLTFGASATTLADFSLEPPKAVAKAKAAATRKARGTTSAKAKKAITGNVSATLVVTPAAPAPATPEPAAPAAPAPTKA